MKHPFWIVNLGLLSLVLVAFAFVYVSSVKVPEREPIEAKQVPPRKELKVAINIKKIYEDDSYLVIWSKGLFNLSAHPLFAKIYIHSKFKNQSWLISKQERAFFMEVLLFFKEQIGEH